MISTECSIDNVIKILNEALKLDSGAINELINCRVRCNERLADHKTIQVHRESFDSNIFTIGLLGILNGLFGVDKNFYGGIHAQLNSSGKITHFFSKI